jgi:hypothetical protein
MVAVASPPKTTAPAKSARPVGTLIDQLWALRESRRKHEAEIEALNKQAADIEAELTANMDADGITKATGRSASLSFSYSVAADVQGEEGWTAFYAFIAKKKYFHLLHRRVSDAAYKEVLASLNGAGADFDVKTAKKQVPGVVPFLKRRVNLRTLST